MSKLLVALSFLFALSGCSSPNPYEQGKSYTDVPSQVNVIYLKKVYMVGGRMEDSADTSGPHVNPDPPEDPNPSQNDREVTAMVKNSISNQLTNLGYSVVENDAAKADVQMSYFIGYIPERWPLIGRTVNVTGRVYDTNGHPIFSMVATRQNSYGLIGAIAGPSRDEMVADAAHEAVVKTVREMRKGMKENAAKTSMQTQ